NVMMPVSAHAVVESSRFLAVAANYFTVRCVSGIVENVERCNEMIEKSLAMATALAPEIGYDAAAAIAKESYKTGKTVRQIAMEKKVMPPKRLKDVLDPMRMTKPGIAAKGE